MKNEFEQHIKKSLEDFEVEYNPADWSDMQSRLSKAKPGKSSGIVKKLMIVASVIATAGIIYYWGTAGQIDEVTKNNMAPSENENSIQGQPNYPTTQEIKTEEKSGKSPLEKSDNTSKETISDVNNRPTQKVITLAENEKEDIGRVSEIEIQQVQSSVPSLDLSASFRADISKVCEGAQIQFSPDHTDASCIFKWNFGDGTTSSEQAPKHIFKQAGLYAVKLRVISAQNKKQAEQKNTITVVAGPSVQMNSTISEDNNLLVNFELDADNAVDWKWDFGDTRTSSEQNLLHIYNKRGIYKVSLIAKNAAGCSTVVVKEVNLKNEINLLAPNAFSPDGNGINDTWMPVALLGGDYIFTLTITDKAGDLVFNTSDKDRPWDGQNAKAGDTFIWRAVVKDKNGDTSNHQGLITVSE